MESHNKYYHIFTHKKGYKEMQVWPGSGGACFKLLHQGGRDRQIFVSLRTTCCIVESQQSLTYTEKPSLEKPTKALLAREG